MEAMELRKFNKVKKNPHIDSPGGRKGTGSRGAKSAKRFGGKNAVMASPIGYFSLLVTR